MTLLMNGCMRGLSVGFTKKLRQWMPCEVWLKARWMISESGSGPMMLPALRLLALALEAGDGRRSDMRPSANKLGNLSLLDAL